MAIHFFVRNQIEGDLVMASVGIMINGRHTTVDVEVSTESAKLDGKDVKLVKHVGSGFQYLAEPSAIANMQKSAVQAAIVIGQLEDSLDSEF